jgi:hypothetical protein
LSLRPRDYLGPVLLYGVLSLLVVLLVVASLPAGG